MEVGQSSDHQISVATYKNTSQENVKNQHFQNSGNESKAYNTQRNI